MLKSVSGSTSNSWLVVTKLGGCSSPRCLQPMNQLFLYSKNNFQQKMFKHGQFSLTEISTSSYIHFTAALKVTCLTLNDEKGLCY